MFFLGSYQTTEYVFKFLQSYAFPPSTHPPPYNVSSEYSLIIIHADFYRNGNNN